MEKIVSHVVTQEYRDGYEGTFGKKKKDEAHGTMKVARKVTQTSVPWPEGLPTAEEHRAERDADERAVMAELTAIGQEIEALSSEAEESLAAVKRCACGKGPGRGCKRCEDAEVSLASHCARFGCGCAKGSK